MCPSAVAYVQPEDWEALSRLSIPRSSQDVHNLFYPLKDNRPLPRNKFLRHNRNPRFLAELKAEEYNKALDYILLHPTFEFLDAPKYVDGARFWGQDASRVMEHVSAWLNPEHQIPNRLRTRSKKKDSKGFSEHEVHEVDQDTTAVKFEDNKPAICLQFIPALNKRYPNIGSDKLKFKAKELEKMVAEHVKEKRYDFQQPSIKPYLVRLIAILSKFTLLILLN